MDQKYDFPPIWPNINTILNEYVECSEQLPIHQIDFAQCYWPRKPDVFSLLNYELSPHGTTLKFDRDPITGCLGQMQEIILEEVGKNSKNSMSMKRIPGAVTDDIRGKITNIPFWPGGFDEPVVLDETTEDIDFERNLRTLPEGFSSGIEFEADNITPKKKEKFVDVSKPERQFIDDTTNKINLMALVEEEECKLDWPNIEESKEEMKKKNDVEKTVEISKTDSNPLPSEKLEISVLKISNELQSNKIEEMEWAEQIDVSVPVTDYKTKIPDPAMTFEYELDTFQKQAILKLEENCNVFVAAHTSAGKTTVAEYAIALTQKHLTKVIYTSPIKVLSNQKFRDFKKKFDSVGLITGDVQINENASCLIMTTEILKSMIYGASEVLRDLEFVIFDEVHYINNEDRGHVWEEIVILLPQTVNIVMLSATVPKPIIFANWVGRIKKRKMYVISTLKRPVPLKHYLFIPNNTKSRGELLTILDENEEFLLNGWHAATKKFQKHDLYDFVHFLSRNDKLPVVVFTLSRKRCDTNANKLKNITLTNHAEKMQVRSFFEHTMKYLKGTDKHLPQVCMMQNLLERGIGIHHSGILPILKETVEILFQMGVVKLLFATETFAMGVNMPARTVVFDSIKKYDGNVFRMLLPTEYIQMAGRAGRRGHDTTGTVIIMCHKEIPHFTELRPLMKGESKTLESQFKVTYSMVLNLRRTNELVTVQSMMRRSFKESCLVLKEDKYQTDLNKIEEELASLPPLTDVQKELSNFYEIAMNYLQELRYLKPFMLENKQAKKSLSKGRVVIVSYKNHFRKLGVLLGVISSKVFGNQYQVFVLKDGNQQEVKNDRHSDNSDNEINKEKSENWYNIIALTKKTYFIPCGAPSHEVIIISPWNLIEITNHLLKIDCNMVLKDWEKRQIFRFRNDKPGPTCQAVVQELMAISVHSKKNNDILSPYVKWKVPENLNPRFIHLRKQMQALEKIKCTDIPNFEEQFEVVFHRMELYRKQKKLQLKLSDEGLSLYPDYINMVALLKRLGYIDNDERVALKGRVALQMGVNELILTELILKNVLTPLQPAKIAALLSAVIYQQKDEEFSLPPNFNHLKRESVVLYNLHQDLHKLEQEYHLNTLQPLNFSLMEAVYEWAQAKSFAEIMQKVDVQEGIIVRVIQQLNETLQDMKNAAVAIGDPVLKGKMEEASTAIKRDIVFAASLYIQE
ncbi:helicase SKI2W [Polistes fuscatus]|uniref:helicase SKI2W n=1 Tax=Polistes fuscatus TaxID=30207 RepID=UPI001CA8E92B|nr:helicase SKI2W [Polistes fuscatus]